MNTKIARITRSPSNIEYSDYTTCKYTMFDDQYVHHPETEYDGIRLTNDATNNCNYNREKFTKEIVSTTDNTGLVTWNIIKEKDTLEENSNYILRVEVAPMVATIRFERYEENNPDPVSTITISFESYATTGSIYLNKVQKTYFILIKSYKSGIDYNEQNIVYKVHESYDDSHLTQINNTPYNRQYNQITTTQYNSESSDYQDCQISISASYAKLWLGYDDGVD